MKKKAVLISVAILALLVVLASIAFMRANSWRANLSQPTGDGPISVRIAAQDNEYGYGDTVTFFSVIENVSGESQTYTFNSTCTRGTLSIDNQPTEQIQACGAAITEVALSPGEKLMYEYEFNLVKEFSEPIQEYYSDSIEAGSIEFDGELLLNQGRHHAYLEWQGFKSEQITFNVVN